MSEPPHEPIDDAASDDPPIARDDRPVVPLVVTPAVRRPPKPQFDLRFGWPAILLCIWTGVGGVLGYVYAATSLVTPQPEILSRTLGALVGVGHLLLGPVLAVLVLVRARRVAQGTPGRFRFGLVAVGALAHALGAALLGTLVWLVLADASAEALGDPFYQPPTLQSQLDAWLMVARGQGTLGPLVAGLVVGTLGWTAQVAGALSAWFLVPQRVRASIWLVVDSVLLVGTVAVVLLLPVTPPVTDPDALVLPSVRLAVTTLAAIRLLFRAIPPTLDLIERVGFRLLIAARLLRARKSGFLTIIGFLSICAVTVSSCMLTTTLSVMGGFRNDLKQKILGNNAHVVVDRERGTFEGWQPTLTAIRGANDVVAASPYTDGEVMITSATNHAGAILRGVEPSSVAQVTDLRRNMRHGRLEYLAHPERLLRLRSEQMGSRSPPSTILRDIDQSARDVDETEEDEAPVVDPDAQRIAEEIDDFLLPEPVAAEVDGETADVLPGLIVGQELARTLRLHVGDEVNVVSPVGELGPSGPMPKSRPFRVAGIFYSGMYEFDMKMAYTALGDAQRYLNVGDAIHGIEVKVADSERAEPIAREIANTIGRADVRVRPWQEVNRTLFGALQLEKLAMFITLGIAILVASFCVVGTLTLMVQEKRKEVGILKAMGSSSEQVVAVFMAQGLMIGLLGAVLGLGLGYVMCFVGEHFGIHLNPEVYYIDRLPVHTDPMEFTLVGVASVLICLLATIYPALLGSRLRPVEALSYS